MSPALLRHGWVALLIGLGAVLAGCDARPDDAVFGTFTATVEGPAGPVTVSGSALARQEPGGTMIVPGLPPVGPTFVITLVEGAPGAPPTASSRLFVFTRDGEEALSPGTYPLFSFFDPADPDDGKAESAFAASYLDPALAGAGRLDVEGGTLIIDAVTATSVRGEFSFEASAGGVPHTARGTFRASRAADIAHR